MLGDNPKLRTRTFCLALPCVRDGVERHLLVCAPERVVDVFLDALDTWNVVVAASCFGCSSTRCARVLHVHRISIG